MWVYTNHAQYNTVTKTKKKKIFSFNGVSVCALQYTYTAKPETFVQIINHLMGFRAKLI